MRLAMKRLLSLTLVMLLTASLFVSAAAVVAQSADYYAADYANVLTAETERKLIDSNSDAANGLEALCGGAQLVVVTVEYLGGMYADEYALQLFNDWGVASNGMLLLLATEENKAWLTVGTGIDSVWTENKLDSTLDAYFWTDFDAGRYDAAVNKLCEGLFTWYAEYYNVGGNTNGGNGYAEPAAPRPNIFSVIWRIFSTFFWIIIIVVLILIFSAGSDRRRYNAYYTHMGTPMPPYHFWYRWGGSHPPYRSWYNQNNRRGGPRGPGPGGGSRPGGGGNNRGGGSGFGGFGGSSGGSSRGGGSGFGGFGGSSGGSSRGGGGGFGGFGGSSGGGSRGGGGGHGGGGGGRR
jgi:uncharacterized membrane protein YgcG